MSFEVTVGAGLLAVVSAFLFVKLKEGVDKRASEKQAQDLFTVAFLLVCFASFLFSIFLVGKIAVDNNDYCSIEAVNQTTVNATLTKLDYGRVCFPNTTQTSNGLFLLSNLWIIVSSIFLTLIMLWAVVKYIEDLFNKYGKSK